jgi:hypothetical protein
MRAIPREVGDGLVRDSVHAYALGAWCADGYWWSSSIGITNTEPEIVERFGRYLTSILPAERLRLRIYVVEGSAPHPSMLALTTKVSLKPSYKMKRTAYQLYVNSRPLVREFFGAREHLELLQTRYLGSYLAGRFDGDGCWGTTPRIVYRLESEARTDRLILQRLGIKSSVLFYAKANEYCVYIHKVGWNTFKQAIDDCSWKASRFTL